MIGLILALLAGCLVGIVTGLLPGLHTNNVALLILGSIAILSKFFSPIDLAVFLIALVIVHSFLDFIPSIFFGAPDAATALGVLPGHKLLLKGEGYKALKLTLSGGIGALLIGLLIIPLFLIFLNNFYSMLVKVIAPLLLILSVAFIIREKKLKKIIWSVIIFLLSGSLGLITLNNLNLEQPLFPLLAGLFGISTLIISLFYINKIVQQKIDSEIILVSKSRIISYLKAAISASITSILPAIGSAQAAIISQGFTRFNKSEDFLVIIGGINTVSALFTLTTLYVIGKSRTGVVAAINQFLVLDKYNYIILLGTIFTATAIAVVLTLGIGRFIVKRISKIDYRKVSIIIIAFIILMVGIFSGWLGLFVVSIATAIGLIAPQVGVKRIHAMGCLSYAVIIQFIYKQSFENIWPIYTSEV